MAPNSQGEDHERTHQGAKGLKRETRPADRRRYQNFPFCLLEGKTQAEDGTLLDLEGLLVLVTYEDKYILRLRRSVPRSRMECFDLRFGSAGLFPIQA